MEIAGHFVNFQKYMKTTRRVLLVAYLTLSLPTAFAQLAAIKPAEPHRYKPADGYVPDSATAIRIAQAVWGPIYGETKIASEAPFRAVLKGDIWIVEGSLPEGYLGGVAIAEISKSDATVLRVSHGK